MTKIIDYKTLLMAGRKQPESQRFLFVFLEATLPENHNDEDKQHFESGHGGELTPLMCVDKDLEELTNFTDLVTESEQINQDWSIVLVACLSGKNGLPTSTESVEKSLKMMVQATQDGSAFSKFLAFNRQGVLLRFS
jgi:hypothetical protein